MINDAAIPLLPLGLHQYPMVCFNLLIAPTPGLPAMRLQKGGV
jgi:hypothetical protein